MIRQILNLSFSRWLGIIFKEFIQLKRDRLTFGMIIGIPVMQLLLFGFAINSDPKHLPTVLLVAETGPLVRDYISAMKNSAYFNIIGTVTSDAATVTHQYRVGAIGMAIAGEMGLPRKRARLIGFAGLVHDIGEGLVRRERSGGNGEFTAEDIALEQAHVRLGYNVLRSFGFPWPIAATVLQHHERFDGSGYPKGLKGEEILLDARIIAVADIIEVLACEQGSDCTERGFAAALVEIEARKGQYYDAAVVEAALRLFREKGYTF